MWWMKLMKKFSKKQEPIKENVPVKPEPKKEKVPIKPELKKETVSVKQEPKKEIVPVKPEPKKIFNTNSLTKKDFNKAAKRLDCEVAAIKAVAEVESAGSGFDSKERPKVLFEAHIFWKELKKVGINPTTVQKGNENILQPTWSLGRKYYKQDQHARLEQAIKIHREAALKSASWGKFQVLGNNYKTCGYKTVQDFINDAYAGEAGHLNHFVGFVIGNKLDNYLRDKNWEAFARRYNGPGFKKNQYDTKMANAYRKYKK